MRLLLTAALALLPIACTPITPTTPPTEHPIPTSTQVTLTPIAEGLWLHTSIRELESGPFPSHGLVVESPKGILLIDSAWGAEATSDLLGQIEAQLGRRPTAAILTDFHDDRSGGSAVLEAAGVEVFTSARIIAKLHAASQPAPQRTLELPFVGELAGTKVELLFPGPGHSPENLVVWLPEQQVLFGGCLIRALDNASLGNLADAELEAWGPSVRALRSRFGHVRTLVPSHGAPGDAALLNHTLALVDIALDAQAQAAGSAPRPTRMAITVDDLPSHGPLPPGKSRAQVHAELLAAFERHGLPEVRGFVIGERAQASDDEREALRLWTAAGQPLGNHTWSHPNMEVIGVDAYLDDIDRNEASLAELTGDSSGESWRSFRYPYLRQGFDQDSSTRVRAHLAERGYQIAEVTIDFWDWDYQTPYVRCLAAAQDIGVAALRRTYLERALELLDWHRAAALDAFGRPISHVLLLHAGVFTAEMIDELLDAYEARGVVWISLEEALADPVYAEVPLPAKTHGDVLVEQAITTLGVDHPPWTHHPSALLDALCR